MEGEMGDEATSSRTSLLGSGDAVGANLPPLGDPNSIEDEMEVVEGPVQNLDQFFTRVYDYYQHKGFGAIFLARALNLCTLAFVILFPTFLVTYVDYHTLFSTNDLGQALLPLELSRLHPFVAVCLALFLLFWLLQFFQFLSEVRDKREIKRFYNQALRINDDKIQTMEWHEVVDRLTKVAANRRLVIVKDELTPLDVVQRIMRRQNYMIALVNQGIVSFSIRLPFLGLCSFWSKTLEWCLSFVLGYTVFGAHSVRKKILQPENLERTARSLQLHLRVFAVAGFFLTPFVLIFLTMYFFLRYGEELRNRPSFTLAARNWSRSARWRLWEYNELPHMLHERLSKASDAAEKYLSHFQPYSVTLIARFIRFVAGAFVAVLILMALLDEDTLLTSHVVGRSLVWWLGVLGTIVALSRAHIPDERQAFAPAPDLDTLVTLTHHKPDSWVGSENTWEVRDEVAELYEFKATSLLRELAAILVGPFILFFSTASRQSTLAIIQFFQKCTDNVEGVGYVCSFGNLDSALDKLGDPEWGSGIDAESPLDKGKEKDEGAPSAAGIESEGEEEQQQHPHDFEEEVRAATRSSRNGKMEKSLLNFVEHYPTWQPARPGQRLLDNLSRHLNTSSRFGSSNEMGQSQGLFGRNWAQGGLGASTAAPWGSSGNWAMGSSWAQFAERNMQPPIAPWASSLLSVQQSFHEQAVMSKPLVPQRRKRQDGDRSFEMHAL